MLALSGLPWPTPIWRPGGWPVPNWATAVFGHFKTKFDIFFCSNHSLTVQITLPMHWNSCLRDRFRELTRKPREVLNFVNFGGVQKTCTYLGTLIWAPFLQVSAIKMIAINWPTSKDTFQMIRSVLAPISFSQCCGTCVTKSAWAEKLMTLRTSQIF